MMRSSKENIPTNIYYFRVTVDHDADGPLTKLHLKAVQVSDEETYVCESTFLEPSENCTNVGTFDIKLDVYGECFRFLQSP